MKYAIIQLELGSSSRDLPYGDVSTIATKFLFVSVARKETF